MFALNLLRSQARRQIRRPNCKQIFTQAKFKNGGVYPTFSDVPIPKGSWQEKNTRTQNQYMAVLISSIVAFIGSVVHVANSDIVVFNAITPDYPYEDEE